MKNFRSLFIAMIALSASLAWGKELRTIRNLKEAVSRKNLVRQELHVLAPQCTDFTGKWEGVCTDQEGETENETIVIVQEKCAEINIDGLPFNINGSLLLQSSPNPDAGTLDQIPYTATVAFAWNDSQTKLRNLAALGLFGGFMSGVINSSMWMSGDQLRTKDERASDLIDIDGESNWNFILQDCTYTRAK